MIIIKDRSEALFILNSAEGLLHSVLEKEHKKVKVVYEKYKKGIAFKLLDVKYSRFFELYLSKHGKSSLLTTLSLILRTRKYLDNNVDIMSLGIPIDFLTYIQELESHDNSANIIKSSDIKE